MIETRLDQMLCMIRNAEILSESAFANADLPKALSVRQTDNWRNYWRNEFDSRWRILQIHQDLREIYDEMIQTVNEVCVERIKKHAPKKKGLDKNTLATELSAQIEDDIAGIAKSRATEFVTEWHDQLWMAYRRDEIPMFSAESIVKPLHLKNTGKPVS